MLVAIGVDRKRASVASRERLAACGEEFAAGMRSFGALDGVDEVFVLSTCYRVELYAASACPSAAAASLAEALRLRAGDPELPLFDLRGPEAFRHLSRVAGSLESGVIGEPQVLGQVKEAFGRSAEAGTIGKELSSVIARILQVAKRIRTETAIGRSGVSWGHASADLAEKVLGPLAGRRAVVVGAGEMARLSAQHLHEQGMQVVVVNRTLANAEALAREIDGEARPIEALGDELVRADVAVVAAPVSLEALDPRGAPALMKRRRHRRLLFIDLAVPRAVPPPSARWTASTCATSTTSPGSSARPGRPGRAPSATPSRSSTPRSSASHGNWPSGARPPSSRRFVTAPPPSLARRWSAPSAAWAATRSSRSAWTRWPEPSCRSSCTSRASAFAGPVTTWGEATS